MTLFRWKALRSCTRWTSLQRFAFEVRGRACVSCHLAVFQAPWMGFPGRRPPVRRTFQSPAVGTEIDCTGWFEGVVAFSNAEKRVQELLASLNFEQLANMAVTRERTASSSDDDISSKSFLQSTSIGALDALHFHDLHSTTRWAELTSSRVQEFHASSYSHPTRLTSVSLPFHSAPGTC